MRILSLLLLASPILLLLPFPLPTTQGGKEYTCRAGDRPAPEEEDELASDAAIAAATGVGGAAAGGASDGGCCGENVAGVVVVVAMEVEGKVMILATCLIC